MSNKLLGLILYILSGSSGLVLAAESTFVLTAGQWNIPRKESTILQMPALQKAMQAFQDAGEKASLLIKYPGGDEGTLWAHELRGWLIALGVASNKIELSPGSARVDQLEIQIRQNVSLPE